MAQVSLAFRHTAKSFTTLRRCAIIVLVLLSVSVGYSQSDEVPRAGLRGFAMSSTFQFDGKEYRYSLSTDEVKDTPSWNISDGEPPLSVVRAVESGKIQLKKLIGKTKGWDVDFVNLHQADRKKWYYEIHFTCIELGCPRGATGGFTVLIKMDGMPVEPTITNVKNSQRK